MIVPQSVSPVVEAMAQADYEYLDDPGSWAEASPKVKAVYLAAAAVVLDAALDVLGEFSTLDIVEALRSGVLRAGKGSE